MAWLLTGSVPAVTSGTDAKASSGENKRNDSAGASENDVKRKTKGRLLAVRAVKVLSVTRIGAKGGSAMPRPVALWPVVRGLRLRFGAASGTNIATGAITLDDVLGAIGVIGRVANTSVTCLATSFKINAVRLWVGPSGSVATQSFVQFLAAGDDHEPDYMVENDIPINMQGGPNMLEYRPPKKSTASMWQRDTATGSDLIMVVGVGTTGSLVEVDLDFTLSTTVASSNAITVTTCSVGVFYRLALNKTNGSSSLVPLSYQTTT